MFKLFFKSIMTAFFIYAMSNYATAQTFSGSGDGMVGTPYLITSAAELDEVRDFLGAGLYFRLENDIDLTSYLATGGPGGAWGTSGWLPIGDNTTRFGGNFDGNGKKITGLWIDRPADDWVGLFGAIGGATAIIHNLGVETALQGITGNKYVGGLVGGVYGSATLTEVYTTGTVIGLDYVGGLSGENIIATINNSFSSCNINGINYYIGGITGIANNTVISNVYATGNVSGNGKIGGLAGVIVSNTIVSYAYSTGIVHGREFVGGLIGEAQSNSLVKNCFVASGSITAMIAADINRIASGGLTGSTFSHNYCVGMALNRASVDISGGIVDDLNDIQGEIKTLADLHAFNFYNTPGNWDGGAWDIAMDNSQTWNISDGFTFPFLWWQYAISVSAPMSFGSLNEGYAIQPALQTVTITNEGRNAVTLIQPVSANYEIGTLSTPVLTATGVTTTFTVRPKPGLAVGTYNETIIIGCSEGVNTTVNVSFTVTTAPSPPLITGDLYLTLIEGYSATSTNAYTITGTPVPTVTKTSGDPLVTWNNATQRLDIAAGLSSGSYSVVLTASNGTAPDAQLTFTLTVEKPAYHVYIGNFTGGSIRSDVSTAKAGQIVTLTISASKDYELGAIAVNLTGGSNASVGLSGIGDSRTFIMPDGDVTVTATFRYHGLHTIWELAKPIIENAVFVVPQAKANTIAALQYALAEIINELIKGTGFVVSPSDIIIFSFNAAMAGDNTNRSGMNGLFAFRVSPSIVNNSAYADGTIMATPFDPTANDFTSDVESLMAWTVSGVLNVCGLTPGTIWQVYNMNGILIYQGVSSGSKAEITLPERGIYLIINENNLIKTVH